MIRAVPLLLAAAAAASPPGCVTPRARLIATVKEGTHPPQALLSCQVRGLSGVVTYTWRMGASLHVVNPIVPRNQAAMLVQLTDPLVPGQSFAECDASDESGTLIGATTSLAPLVVQKVTPQAGPDPYAAITVEGSGFGPTLAPDGEDGLYFVPARGAAVRADHACKGAQWSDARVVACRPATLAAGRLYELRVEAGGRLAVAPGPPVRPLATVATVPTVAK